MKTIKHSIKVSLFSALFLAALFGCERDLTENAEFSTFSKTAEIFTDTFIGLGEDFFFPYSDGFAKAEILSVESGVSYKGTSSMRIDVPDNNDPDGSYAGAFFRVDGSGRNLTGYNALTFWAKASQSGNIESVGFGQSESSKYEVSANDLHVTTTWKKYIIPIPDPSKLVEERGMFWLSDNNNPVAYTIWFDEIRFEKLGTLGQPRPAIMNGEDVVENTFNGVSTNVTGLTQTLNTGTGENITVNAAPAYYTFHSSNPNVAIVNESGVVSVLNAGTAKITATLAGVAAKGSLTINSLGAFTAAPTPTRDASTVISIFSDAYTNVPIDYYNGFFAPFQTTQGGFKSVGGGENIIHYTDLNFVAIGTFRDVPSVDASGMTHMHVDINVQEAIDAGDFIRLQLINSVGNNETSGDYTIDGSQLTTQGWASFDIPLASFSGPADKSKLGLYFFISDGTISNIFVDNLYFYKV